MTEIHILRPYILIAILPLALLWLYARHKTQQGGWNKLLAPQLAEFLLTTSGVQGNKRSSIIFPLLWLLSLIALSGPSWQKQPMPVFQVDTARVLILDMSRSMLATDLSPNRLSIARYKAQDLLSDWREGQSALVAYANDAFVISPLTKDTRTLISQLPALHPNIMPEQGSKPMLAIEQAIKLLEDGGFDKGQLVLFTDGIDSQSLDNIKSRLSNTAWQLTIVGFGTEQGAPIKLANGQFLKQAGEIIVAPLNQNELSRYCLTSNCNYLKASADNGDIIALRSLLKSHNPKTLDEEKTQEEQPMSERWFDGGIYGVYLMIPLFLILFYRQWLLLVLIFIIPMSFPNKALADSDTPSVQLGSPFWNNQADRAQEAFEKEDYEQASKLYQSQEWQATADYRAGNFESAAQKFSELQTSSGYYNQGNALAKLGNLEQAIKAYDNALILDPNNKDAAANKALLAQIEKQKQEDKQENKQEKDQEQEGDEQKQDDKSEQKDSKDQDGKEQDSDQNSEQSDKQNQDKPEDSEPKAGDEQKKQELSEQQKQALQEQAEKENEKDKSEKQPEKSQEQNEDKQLNEDQEQQMIQQIQQAPKEPDDPELRQLFRQLPDDPALLLRNRMLLEQQKRGRQSEESNSKW